MFHDPDIAEIRRIRADLMREQGDDLHRLCASLRQEQVRLAAQGHPLLPEPLDAELARRLADLAARQPAA